MTSLQIFRRQAKPCIHANFGVEPNNASIHADIETGIATASPSGWSWESLRNECVALRIFLANNIKEAQAPVIAGGNPCHRKGSRSFTSISHL